MANVIEVVAKEALNLPLHQRLALAGFSSRAPKQRLIRKRLGMKSASVFKQSQPANSGFRNHRAKGTSVEECAIIEAAMTIAMRWNISFAWATPDSRMRRP